MVMVVVEEEFDEDGDEWWLLRWLPLLLLWWWKSMVVGEGREPHLPSFLPSFLLTPRVETVSFWVKLVENFSARQPGLQFAR